MSTTLDLIAAWAVPPSAVRLGRLDELTADVLEELERLVVVRTFEPVAFRWTDDGDFVECPLPTTDDERDECLLVEPEQPDLEDVARMIVSTLRERRAVPGPLSWRRWPVVLAFLRVLYRLGVVASFGTTFQGGDVSWFVSGRVRLRGRRPYVLGLPDWWWRCQRGQRWRLRGRHRPLRPFFLGICAACAPCPDCGAPFECDPGCSSTTENRTVLPQVIDGCRWTDAEDGTCAHPDAYSPECWRTPDGATSDCPRILPPGEGA